MRTDTRHTPHQRVSSGTHLPSCGNVLDIGKVARDILLLRTTLLHRFRPISPEFTPKLPAVAFSLPVPTSTELFSSPRPRCGLSSFLKELGRVEIKRPNEGNCQRVEVERVRRGSMHRDKAIRSAVRGGLILVDRHSDEETSSPRIVFTAVHLTEPYPC